MAKDYTRKTGKYRLPKEVYNQVLWRVRDYQRRKTEADAMIGIGGMPSEVPSESTSPSDKVGNTVIKRERLMSDVYIIDRCLREEVPEEYRKGVWENIQKRKAFPNDAARSTYAEYKSRFIYKLAEEFKII